MNQLVDSSKPDTASPAREVLPTVPTRGRIESVFPHRNRTWNILGVCCLALLAGLAVGCGDGKPVPLKVYPVTGTVKFQGKPAAGASVTLFPKDSSIPEDVRPNAITDETGHFDLGTYSDIDGAPEGEYAVTITWRPLVHSGGSASPGPNVLPVRYSQPETSQLTAQVNGEETELKAFELTP